MRSLVSINSAQSLHHFIANSDWSVNELKIRRLNKIKRVLNGNAITLVIDETGDRKKGKKTNYVARQYLGSVGKVDNGIVSVKERWSLVSDNFSITCKSI